MVILIGFVFLKVHTFWFDMPIVAGQQQLLQAKQRAIRLYIHNLLN